MKRKINSIIAITGLAIALFSSCCKDESESYAFLVGQWSVVKMDSCQYSDQYDTLLIIKEIPTTGTFSFNVDRTGEVYSNFSNLSGTENTFIWDYDATTKMIDFNFQNGTSVGLISECSDQELTFYFREYLTQPHFNTIWYKIQLVK